MKVFQQSAKLLKYIGEIWRFQTVYLFQAFHHPGHRYKLVGIIAWVEGTPSKLDNNFTLVFFVQFGKFCIQASMHNLLILTSCWVYGYPQVDGEDQ